jgi:hypothetical protein
MKDFVEITFNPINGLESVRASILTILIKWWEGHKLGVNAIDDMTQCMMHSNRGTVLLLFKKEAMVTIQQKSDNISKAVSQLQELLKGIEE